MTPTNVLDKLKAAAAKKLEAGEVKTTDILITEKEFTELSDMPYSKLANQIEMVQPNKRGGIPKIDGYAFTDMILKDNKMRIHKKVAG